MQQNTLRLARHLQVLSVWDILNVQYFRHIFVKGYLHDNEY